MKRIITLTFIMCCLLLTGCDNASIGVIGGADGPTKIIVSEKENSTIKSSDVKKFSKNIMSMRENCLCLISILKIPLFLMIEH